MPHLRSALTFALLASVLLGTSACKKKSEEATSRDTKLTSATGNAPSSSSTAEAAPPAAPSRHFVPSHPVPPFKGAFPHRAEPLADATGRVVSIKLVRNEGVSDDAPIFALTNLTKETVAVSQTWIYYYDAQRKQIDRYPHSLGGSFELAPGETKEKRLGEHIGKIKKETSIMEGEVSSATVGGKPWKNENLVSSFDRPVGGYDLQTLEDRAGERVIVDMYSLGTDRVRLTNITDHPVKSVDLRFHYIDAKGEIDWNMAPSQELKTPLLPGQSVDFKAKMLTAKDRPPPGARKVVAFAEEVRFADGSPTFKNKNLGERNRWEGLVAK